MKALPLSKDEFIAYLEAEGVSFGPFYDVRPSAIIRFSVVIHTGDRVTVLTDGGSTGIECVGSNLVPDYTFARDYIARLLGNDL